MTKRTPEYLRELDVYPSYRGGHTCVQDGYVWEFCPGHHLQNNWGWVAQHRLVAEDKLGRRLVQSKDDTICEAVHHRDECRKNNDPDNLEVMSRRDHRVLHARLMGQRSLAKITAEQVSAALDGRSLKDAARLLKVDTMTLRNRFPELIAPRKRKSPAKLDEAELIGRVRELAASPAHGLREIAEALGIAVASVQRIVKRNDIPWTRKSKVGEVHKTYRKKPTQRLSVAHGSAIEPAPQ